MDFKSEESTLYFSTFANTSRDKKHKIREAEREIILMKIKNGNVPDNLDNFVTAFVGCSAISRGDGKDAIDKETVEKYFLGPHNLHSTCKAYQGIVTKTTKKQAKVKIPNGEVYYKTLMDPNVKVGDDVIVHGRYVVGVRK